MSEVDGLWKHENNQRALVPPKMECGCPNGRGIQNGHICYSSYGRTQKKKKVPYPVNHEGYNRIIQKLPKDNSLSTTQPTKTFYENTTHSFTKSNKVKLQK